MQSQPHDCQRPSKPKAHMRESHPLHFDTARFRWGVQRAKFKALCLLGKLLHGPKDSTRLRLM